ncbi:methylmalonyl-CoA mutase family protein [Myxococcus landrumensis]|uniref:Methylmalonyl-CoA mutase small subunit n=1 Tax=Myxococcus landrumensis TaxID=2813577 RepID=A0ABX7NAS3_9BACT|nr:methylmalonyl-CoA mutase family protein [Myxococcus landrumus]QSQ15867.1 methylmalonyl-CoA mutase small subunit [Myxococcus landrumus]
MSQVPLHIAAEFPPRSLEEWRRLVDKDLKGKPFTSLQSPLEGGLSLQPLYVQQDEAPTPPPPGVAPYLRGTQALGHTEGGWLLCQEYSEPEVAHAAQALKADLERGTQGVWLCLGDSHGIPVKDAASMAKLLADVPLARTPVHLEPEAAPLSTASLLLSVAEKAGVAKSTLSGSLGVDPVGILARAGSLPSGVSVSSILTEAAPLVTTLHESAPELRVLLVSTRAYADAGATSVHELAWAIATGVEYLRGLERAGVSPDVAARSVQFALSVGGQFFPEIAKLRAARLLWAKVVAASGGSPEAQAMRLHARTANANKTQRDPWVNILRTTAESFAAVVAGADSVSTSPFDEALGTPDEGARRLARNTQLILRDESSLNRVADPSGGSYYLEQLTSDFARAAWEELRRIEGLGGMEQALAQGDIARVLEETRTARDKAVRTRKQPIVGVSEYPFLGEAPVRREARAPSAASAGLRPSRVAESFEALRDASDRYLTTTGHRPIAFLASLGTVAEHTTRSTWVANALGAGGIESREKHGFADIAATVAAFRESGATLAVISGPDALYPEWVPALTAQVKAQGARAVAVAGRPGEHEAAFRAAGVDLFIYAGADLVALLTSLHTQLGVA